MPQATIMSLFGKIISSIEPDTKKGMPPSPGRTGVKGRVHTASPSSSAGVPDDAYQIIKMAEEEARSLREESLKIERRLAEKEEEIAKKLSEITAREESNNRKQAEIEEVKKHWEERLAVLDDRLVKIASLTKEEARQQVLGRIESQLTDEVAKRVKEAEEQIKARADEKAKEFLTDAMLHGATDYVAEYTTSAVKLQNEDMKGRIIGKEGRNIRTFETVTGVDVDLDTEDPLTVRLSSFDSVRREIAKVTMEKLIRDTRIQPTRIEEIYESTKREIEKIMEQEGLKLIHQVGVYNLPIELVRMLGRFKYRFSYGQNMIAHTLEETKIGIALAQEIGADVNVVRLGCLLHDIGKIVIDEEGTHVTRGVEIARKFHMPQSVIDCIAQHHEDEPFTSVESTIVYIADAISGSRPGARHEPVEEYIKRLSDIEKIANSFDGVSQSYAIQAGREVRVVVEPEKIDDAAAVKLAHDVARRLEKEIVERPGQIKVTVVRETRVTESTKDSISGLATAA